jgi:hypothetical protein
MEITQSNFCSQFGLGGFWGKLLTLIVTTEDGSRVGNNLE